MDTCQLKKDERIRALYTEPGSTLLTTITLWRRCAICLERAVFSLDVHFRPWLILDTLNFHCAVLVLRRVETGSTCSMVSSLQAPIHHW